MNKKLLKKTGIITGSILLSVYLLFLIVPFFLNGIAKSCGNYISTIVKDTTGFVVKLDNIRFVTTPKLTAGAKVGTVKVAYPSGEEFLSLDNAYGKISLLPLIIKRIEVDAIGVDNIDLSLKVRNDGKFLLEEYLTATEQTTEETGTSAPVTGLSMGLKLSNHLPDIHVKNYKLGFVDMQTDKQYYIDGKKFNITDFILDKKIKVSTDGRVVFDEKTPFNYDIKIYNKIMPSLQLNDLVFAPQQTQKSEPASVINFNIIDIFETINKNMFTADLKADVTTEGSLKDMSIHGLVNVDKLSIAADGVPLPEGHVLINNKGKSIAIDSVLYTARDEATTVLGNIKTGKNPQINITCKSNAQINNVINLIDSIAKSAGYKDLDTLSATGKIEADFSINADMKKVHSSGYLKIPMAAINYALYNILIDKITADVDFSNDMVNINNIGFSVLNQPLKAYGTIKQDTASDLHLIADKLPIKGLIVAAAQSGLLKENDVKSGTISIDASVTGKLDKAQPVVNLSVDNVNVLNIPTNTTVKLATSKLNLSASDKSYKGIVDVNSVQILNPVANLSMPQAKVTLDEKDVVIDNTYLLIDNSRIDISGKITDYADKNIAMNITASGNITGSDLLSMVPADLRTCFTAAGKLPVYFNITGNNKAQNIKAQILATPSNYFNILSISQLKGKNTLISSDIKITSDTLKLSDTGLFTTGAASLPATQTALQLVSVSGAVDKLSSNQILNGINISIPSLVNFEIPGFKNSSASAKGDITMNGSVLNPSYKGNISVPEINIPSIKTSLKNIAVDINPKSIVLNTPTITVDNSVMKAKTTVSTNFNNGIIVNNIDYHADLLDTDTLIRAMEGLPVQSSAGSGKSPNGNASSVSNTDLGVIVQTGNGTISRFKSGGIAATDITSDFCLKNNTLYLKSLQGTAFEGKFNGDAAVNLTGGNTNVDFHGTGMNAEKAIEGSAGLKNALSGTLGFNANISLNAYASSEAAMMQSLKGNVDFDIQNGTFGNIGRLENLLYAENIMSNSIMSAAIAPIVNMPVVQSAANFKSITGDLSFNNGWAALNSIKSCGPSMSAYIFGKYNLLNATANMTILGRLGAEIVAVLGPVGELSVDKLMAFIPKFGAATSKILNAMTTNPNGEKTDEIPALSNGNKNYKDFKVSFNGGVESKSSVKSFKWLSVCDTSQIEGGSLKEQLQQSQETMNQLRQQKKEEIQKNVQTVKDTAKQTSEDIKNQIQNTKDSINELKNLFKKPASTPAATSAETATPAAVTKTAAP